MSEGWFKIHRVLFEKAIWLNSTLEQKVILITILSMANHEKREWEWKGTKFKAEAGQFVTSLEGIVKKSGDGISLQNVRTALKKFERYDFLTQEVTKTGRLIKIVNWELYQGKQEKNIRHSNSELTSISQTADKEVTTNKNNKNYKNYKNNIFIEEFTKNKLLIESILEFIKMRERIKKPITDRGLKILLNKLKDLSQDEETQIKILENSIEHCWQGLYPLKEEKYIYGRTSKNIKSGERKFNIKIPERKPKAGAGCTRDRPF
ncbi:hypothetical protein OD350_15395 [Clostridium beijerinckii]|uniref:hypothetical protein n=1 Tax=Clostridium beijerinckii TaxID=1520 RepID=UPI002225E87B|nr:hypothetical protein [Clostridium beijerinckii]UYZ33649.1 hypothetical protein OD350_15395 [Clostridium beijerinckii]